MSAAAQALRRINPAIPIVIGLMAALVAIGIAFSDRFGTCATSLTFSSSRPGWASSASGRRWSS